MARVPIGEGIGADDPLAVNGRPKTIARGLVRAKEFGQVGGDLIGWIWSLF